MPTRISQRKTATKQVETPPPPTPPPPAAAPSGMSRRSKRVVESVSPEPEPETVEPSDEEDAEGEDEDVLPEGDEDGGYTSWKNADLSLTTDGNYLRRRRHGNR